MAYPLCCVTLSAADSTAAFLVEEHEASALVSDLKDALREDGYLV